MRSAAVTTRSTAVGVIAFALTLVVCILLLVARGHEAPEQRMAAILNAFVLLVNAGLLAGAYLLAGVGLGRPVAWALGRLPGMREAQAIVGPLWLQAALGVGAMLFMSHALGMAGLLSGPTGLWVAWGSTVVGLLLLADQVVRGPLHPERWHPLPRWSVLAAPALAVLFAAACNPPTGLWLGARSEGGGYDVLSYHLELPKEWIAAGSRLWPVEHNVYSFLPSYMEAAYLHIGAMSRGGLPHGGSFIVGSGLGVSSAQFLHAFMGLMTALFVGRLTTVAIGRRAAEAPTALPGAVAGASVLGVPWVVVAGSLAYNDLGVTAMLAAALLVSVERAWSPLARGAGVGLLMGLACSIKPTAMVMAAPLAGLFLLFQRPQPIRDRIVAALAGSVAGLIAMAPWLIRNWIACGNPVFPFAHRIFGLSHWTQEQMDRYAGAHAFSGSALDRLRLFFSADRGILNEQWAVLFPLGALAVGVLTAMKSTRRIGALLLLGVASQILAWLFLTHLQSRFLLPAVIPLALALGLASMELIRWVSVRTAGRAEAGALRRLATLVVALVPLSLTCWSWLVYISQRDGHPNQLLAVGGTEFLTGEDVAADFAQASPPEQARALENFAPVPYINFTMTQDDAVYFVGGATPLFYYPAGGVGAVVYHTTWDHDALGEAMRTQPDDPRAWTAAVRGSRRGPDVTFVLVDFDELSRLSSRVDGREPWIDPGVTPERLRRWLNDECEPVHAWRPAADAGGMALFRLKAAGGATKGGAGAAGRGGERP